MPTRNVRSVSSCLVCVCNDRQTQRRTPISGECLEFQWIKIRESKNCVHWSGQSQSTSCPPDLPKSGRKSPYAHAVQLIISTKQPKHGNRLSISECQAYVMLLKGDMQVLDYWMNLNQ